MKYMQTQFFGKHAIKMCVNVLLKITHGYTLKCSTRINLYSLLHFTFYIVIQTAFQSYFHNSLSNCTIYPLSLNMSVLI